MELIFFVNADSGAVFEAEIESDSKKNFVKEMKKSGYMLVSQNDYLESVKANKKILDDEAKKIYDEKAAKLKQAIKDAKNLGWTDSMIEVYFGEDS